MAVTRRQFLSSTVLASAALAGSASAAHAFSVEEANAGLADEYHVARAAACSGPTSYHQQILADIRALLNGRDITVDEKRKIVAGATCPLCGCPIAGT